MPKFRLPTLKSMQAFEAVARCGGTVAAARELGVTAGAISQQIHGLESSIGVVLFERRGRSLELTTWGRIYFERIGVGFDHLRAAQDVLNRARQKSGIVLSSLPSLTIRWLRPLMSEWQTLHPGSSVRLIGEDNDPDLDEEQVDFRICYGQPQRRYIHYTELFVDWVIPVCTPDFLSQHRASKASDFLKCPLIGIEWDVRHRPPPSWADWAASLGLHPPGRPCELSFSLSSAAIDAALNDAGAVLGQATMVSEDLRKGKLVCPFDHRLRLPEPYVLAWNPAALNRPLGSEFKTFLVKAARRQAAESAVASRADAQP